MNKFLSIIILLVFNLSLPSDLSFHFKTISVMVNLLSMELKLTLIKGLRIQLRNTALGKSLSNNPASPGIMEWPLKVTTLLKAAFT